MSIIFVTKRLLNY